MGNDRGGRGKEEAADARRDFLRTAAIAGTGAFAAPMIITLEPADAQAIESPPPQPPGSATGPGVGPGTSPANQGTRPAARPPASGRTQLPRTGADIDRTVAAGLAATAGGAALVLWSAEMKSKSAAPRPADHEPEA